MRIVVVSAFWNAEKYIEKCVRSVMLQSHGDFCMYLIDDRSDDRTVDAISPVIAGDPRFKLVENKEKKFKLRNLDELICDETKIGREDVIVELDGDDWLFDDSVIARIHREYAFNSNLWMTSGSFVYSTGEAGIAAKVNPMTARRDPFTLSHLRTWRAFLWRSIKKESFMDAESQYFRSAPDVAYTFPMVEMAGHQHYKFIPEVLYVYNAQSPFNEHKPASSGGGVSCQDANAQYIRTLKPYRVLHLGREAQFQGRMEQLLGSTAWHLRRFPSRVQRWRRRLLASES